MKRRHVRRRQWERYVSRLAKRGPGYLLPPGWIREHNRAVDDHNRKQRQVQTVELNIEDGTWW